DCADDRPREVAADAVERIHFLAEERRGVERVLPAGVVVILPEDHAGVLPQHLVLAHITQLNVRHDRDGVTGGELLRVEAGRVEGDRCHIPDEDGIDPGVLGQNPVLPPADELRPDLLRQQRFEVEHRRVVRERRNANRADVRRKKSAAAGEGVPAACGAYTKDTKDTKDTKEAKNKAGSRLQAPVFRRPGLQPPTPNIQPLTSILYPLSSILYPCTTTLTNGPFATKTFWTVFPAVC